MNADVAQSTFLILRIEHVVRRTLIEYAEIVAPEGAGSVVAFEAQSKCDGSSQEFRVSGSVRRVAAGAAFNAHTRMFVNEGAAFIDVAFQARLLVIETVPR